MASGLELTWDAPAECPDAQAVRARVLGFAGAAQAPRQVKAKGTIRPADDTGLMLTLGTEFDGVSGERTLRGVSCDSLTDAAALVLAMIVNPGMALAPPQPEAPSTTPASQEPKDRAPRPVMRVGAYAGLQTGVIEELSPSYMLSLGVAMGRLSFHLMPGLTPPQDVTLPNSQVGGRLWLATVDALGCWSPNLGRVVLRPCLGWNLTRLHGRGRGVAQVRETSVMWSSAELAVFAGLPLGRHLLVEVGGIGQVPLHRPRVYLDDIGAVSQPAAFGFNAVGGLAWLFD
jgi:hypothetical protein